MDLLKSIFKGDKVIWIIFLFLCLISITEVFSAASTLTYKSGDHWGPITQHSIILMVGAVIVVLMHNIPYKWFQVFPVFLLPASAILLVLVMMMERINGAARWMTFMGIQFQPRRLQNGGYHRHGFYTIQRAGRGRRQSEGFQADYDNNRSYLPAHCSGEPVHSGIVVRGGLFDDVHRTCLRKKLLILIGGLASVGIIAVTFLLMTKNSDIPFLHRFDTWRARIEKFTSDKEVPAAKFDIDKDAQIAHARIAVATSNVVGKGPGNSVQRDFLSQAFSDFIFAIIIEELGLVGGVVVVFLYICLLIRVGRIAKKCDRTFPAFLIIGIALLLVSQAVFNMMVAVGLAPVTGQPLPLISKGGTSTLINCAYIGMILSVSRYTAKLEEQREHDAQITMQVEAGNGDESIYSEAQSAAEPTAKMLNSDAEFE